MLRKILKYLFGIKRFSLHYSNANVLKRHVENGLYISYDADMYIKNAMFLKKSNFISIGEKTEREKCQILLDLLERYGDAYNWSEYVICEIKQKFPDEYCFIRVPLK